MTFAPLEPILMPPQQVAPDTFVIRSAQPAFGAPLSVGLHSLVIRADEPVIVDTGTRANRDRWLEDTFNLVDPDDVRWVFISHEDHDHTGNLDLVLERCPRATVVTSWIMNERISNAFHVPPERMRWVDDGGQLDVGDRVLRAVRPPVYDSPTTRGLFDPSTGVYWASDCFATPMPAQPVEMAAELPPPMWAEGLAMFAHHGLAPWLPIVDRAAFSDSVTALRSLGAELIVGAHTPTIDGAALGRALDHLGALPDVAPPPHPDQSVLEAILAGAAPPG